jgi:serine/threonine protein kinase
VDTPRPSEFLSGGNLEDYLLSQRKLNGGRPWRPPPKLLLQWSIELARALCFLHNCNPVVIHRDLKPANLLLNEDCHLKVGDFGLSKVKDMQKIAGTYCMTGKTGSMRYMAPEVFLDQPEYDEKVDIFSSALIMWYMALGERPFDRIPAQLVAEKASSSELRPSLDGLRAHTGPQFADLVKSAWSSVPSDRPSANQMVDELEDMTKKLSTLGKKGQKCVIS